MKIKSSSEGKRRFQPLIRKGKKVGRNDPCPCGSGKKYKHCCLPKEIERDMQIVKERSKPRKKFTRTKHK